MHRKIMGLAALRVFAGLSNPALAANVIKTASCYDMQYYERQYDEATGNPLPETKPILGTDLWNNQITDYKKAMELRLKDDGTIDVYYTDVNSLYGTYRPYLIENTFLNFRADQDWQGQNIHFDWGKSILQLRNVTIDYESDPFGDYAIPMIGEYWQSNGHEKLERLEGDQGFVSFEIKKKDNEEGTLKLTDFSTMYRPYITQSGELSRYAGDSTFCNVEEAEVIFQEVKKREDFILLQAPKKVMTMEEVKSEVEGKLAKSIICPQPRTTDEYQEAPSEKECTYMFNAIYSGLMRVNSQDISSKNPEVKDLINKNILIGEKYDYEVYDEQTDTWSISPEAESAIFISTYSSHYEIAEIILKALKGEENY